jgi:hypothetical protein
MKIYKLWESTGGMIDSLDMKARIIKIDDEYDMEVVCRDDYNFWQRLKVAVKYVFNSSKIVFGIVSLDEEDIERLGELKKYVRK